MKHARRRQGKGAFDLIEEAVHLLRTAPPSTLAAYYLGAIPFVLGLLFFWADMSRSPFANQHLADASLALAALFFWMKFWQAVFAQRIRAHIAAEPPPALNFRLGTRILLSRRRSCSRSVCFSSRFRSCRRCRSPGSSRSIRTPPRSPAAGTARQNYSRNPGSRRRFGRCKTTSRSPSWWHSVFVFF